MNFKYVCFKEATLLVRNSDFILITYFIVCGDGVACEPLIPQCVAMTTQSTQCSAWTRKAIRVRERALNGARKDAESL